MTQPNHGFPAKRLEELAQELLEEKEKTRLALSRLSDAEAVIRFYANPKNYRAKRQDETNQVLQNSLEGDFTNSDNDPNTKLAGAKAREYLKRYED